MDRLREAYWEEFLNQNKVRDRDRSAFVLGWNAALMSSVSALAELVGAKIQFVDEPDELGQDEGNLPRGDVDGIA